MFPIWLFLPVCALRCWTLTQILFTVFQFQAANVTMKCRECSKDTIWCWQNLRKVVRAGTAWTAIAELRLRKKEKKSTGIDAGEYELMIIPQGAQQLQGTAELQVHCEQSAITQRCLIWGLQSTCGRVSESRIHSESVRFHLGCAFCERAAQGWNVCDDLFHTFLIERC